MENNLNNNQNTNQNIKLNDNLSAEANQNLEMTYLRDSIRYLKNEVVRLSTNLASIQNEQLICKPNFVDLNDIVNSEHNQMLCTTQILEDRIEKLEKTNQELLTLLEINNILEENSLENYRNALSLNKKFEPNI